MSNNTWFRKNMYESYEKLVTNSNNRMVKFGRGMLNIQQLTNIICQGKMRGISCVKLSDELPRQLVPYGRQNDFIDRDYTFYRYTQQHLTNEESGVLYISYTGHTVATASALAEKNIPLIWQMDLSESGISEKRVLEQLQDYSSILIRNNESNTANLGIMLELDHNLSYGYHDYRPTVMKNMLPDIDFLKQIGIKKVKVFTEDTFSPASKDQTSIKYILGIETYLESLRAGGLPVSFVGVDSIYSEYKEAFDFEAKKEQLTPKLYLNNFNINKKMTLL